MKRVSLIVVLCLVNILGAVDLDQGLTMISERFDRLNALLKNQDLDAESKREKLSQVIETAIDFEAVTQKALGPFASKLTPEQSKRFHKAFKKTVKDWMIDDLMLFEDEEITLLEFAWLTNEKKVLVKTLGREKSGLAVTNRYKQRARTDYVLKTKDDKWVVVDLTINQVNIAMNYRSQIDALVSRGKSADDIIQLFEKLSEAKL